MLKYCLCLFLSYFLLIPPGHRCVENVYTVLKNNYINVSMNVLLLLIPAVKVNVKTTT